MLNSRTLPIISIFIFLSYLAGCAGYSNSIHVHEKNNCYELHVPASKLALAISKNGFIPKDNRVGGGTNNPRYFFFVNNSEKIILSGWFEPDRNYPGIEKYWSDKEKNRSDKMPPSRNVNFKKVHGWDTVFYSYRMNDYTVSRFNNKGPEYVNSVHVNAHWVQAGTWIDIHISISSDLPDDDARAKLENVLETIKVFEL